MNHLVRSGQSCGDRAPRRLNRIARLLPYIGAPLLIATASAGWLAQSRLAQAQDFAPINRRFEVHRTAEGFELLGFRAQVGETDRFILYAGMPAAQARMQMLSVQWAWSYGLYDPESTQLWGTRVRFRDIVETVAVILDEDGQFVQTVAYERQPAFYSRFGLDYYLNAAFREGRVLVDQPDRMLIEYPSRDGQILRVEATQLPGHQTQWRLVYRMDLEGTPGAVGSTPAGPE
jgi:hypothetical protein